MQWRPIETAPRNGLLLLCTDGGIVFVGKLNKHLQIWVSDDGRERFRTVKFWMDLPQPPSGYWCVVCGRWLLADDLGVIVHDHVPHPESMTFDDEERPQ